MRRMGHAVIAAAAVGSLLVLVLALACTGALAAEEKPPGAATPTTPQTLVLQLQSIPPPTPPAGPDPVWAVEWFRLPEGADAAVVDNLVKALKAALPAGEKATPPLFSAEATRTRDGDKEVLWLVVCGAKAQRDAVWKALDEAGCAGALGPTTSGAQRARTWQLNLDPEEPGFPEGLRRLLDQGQPSYKGRYRLAGSMLTVWVTEEEAAALPKVLAKGSFGPTPTDPVVCETTRLYYARDPATLKGVLEALKAKVAPDVVVTASGASGGYATVTFAGTHGSIRKLRRAVAAIDLPHPTIRLELTSVQLSGSKPAKVTEVATAMRSDVDWTQRAMSAYLQGLRQAARQAYADGRMRDAGGSRFLAQLSGQESYTGPSGETVILSYQLPQDPEHLDHLLSFSEIMLGFLAVGPHEWGGGGMMRGEPLKGLEEAVAEAVRPEAGASAPPPFLTALKGETLYPSALAGILDDQRGNDVAREAVKAFGADYDGFVMHPDSFSPYYLGRRAAQVDQYLQLAEAALSRDLDRIFIRPLMAQLNQEMGGAQAQDSQALGTRRADRIGGMASVGRTTLAVISDTTAKVTGSAVSYFDVSQLPRLDAETVARAAAVRDSLYKTVIGSPTTGTEAAADLLNTAWGGPLAGAVASGLVALGQPQEQWSVLREGTELEFTPYILPGATQAEVKVHAIVAHDDPAPPPADSKAPTETSLHLTRVAKHEATTTLYLDTYDLFDLSALALRTSHPRPAFRLPILGQLPFVGDMFSIPRDPRMVHHESLLIVRASIVPTAMDVARLHPIEPPKKARR